MTTKTSALGLKTVPDEMSLARLRRAIGDHLGDVPLLDAHLALLDSRGVLYATHAIENWSDLHPAEFFGMVRHVIRTQCDGPAPDPDVEGWLAAGRPEDERLGLSWDLLNVVRYGNDALPATPRPALVAPAIEAFDELLRTWDVGAFADAYCKMELFLSLRGVTLPPLTV